LALTLALADVPGLAASWVEELRERAALLRYRLILCLPSGGLTINP
jgi:hypothetical protein